MDGRAPGRPRKKLPIFFDVARGAYLQWLRTAAEKQCKHRSIKTIDHRLHNVMRHLGKDYDFHNFCELDVRKFTAERLGEGVGKHTINLEIAALSSLQKYIVEEAKLLPEYPVKKVARLKFKIRRKPKITVLTDDQVRHLLATTASYSFSVRGSPTTRTLMVLKIAAYAGFRHQEIAHLQRRDIDLQNRRIYVSAKPDPDPKKDWSPKTHEERNLHINDQLAEALAKYLESEVEADPKAWLFPGYGGYCIYNFNREVQEAFRKAGLAEDRERPGLHQLRRTWATNLLKTGRRTAAVMKIGGWASITSVERYLGSTSDDERDAIDSLPNLEPELKSAPAPAAPGGINPKALLRYLVEVEGKSLDEAYEAVEKMKR